MFEYMRVCICLCKYKNNMTETREKAFYLISLQMRKTLFM